MNLRFLLIGSLALSVVSFAVAFAIAEMSGLHDYENLPHFLIQKYSSSKDLSTLINEEMLMPVNEVTALIVNIAEHDLKIISTEREDIAVRVKGRVERKNDKTPPPLVRTDILDNELRLSLHEDSLKSEVTLGDKNLGVFISLPWDEIQEGVGVEIEVPRHFTRIEVFGGRGDVALNVEAQRLSVRTSSGDIELSQKKVDAEIELETQTGDVEVKILGSPNLQLTAQSHGGDLEIFNSKLKATKYESSFGEGRGRLFIQSVSGDIEVE